ncbi:hypothetical protein MAR_020987 [Mya arenaria]|uniref:Uncharacterized protein n=1 Tax=Mya arenaria TaxID=6604 RepID=A0ABY7EA45_MYAAR|nr:hypothetical protein MAR_020987 [Mya arenaria]
MTFEEAERFNRTLALQRYKSLAILMYVLSVGLLVIGVTAVIKYPVSGVGTPYYGGCFIVGCLALIYALVCSYIAFKGADDTNNGTSKKEVVHALGVHSPPPPNYPVGGVYDKSEHPFPSAPPSPSCPPPSYDSLK